LPTDAWRCLIGLFAWSYRREKWVLVKRSDVMKAGVLTSGAALLLLATLTPIGIAAAQQSATIQRADIATGVSGKCRPNLAQFKTSTLDFNTNSVEVITVPETTIAFTQGGRESSCVIVSFSAEASITEGGVMSIYALIDDKLSEPNGVLFTQEDKLSARAFNFVFPNVSPGQRRLKIQIQTNSPDKVARIHFRSTIIHYRS
jgi:hypothetical protein